MNLRLRLGTLASRSLFLAVACLATVLAILVGALFLTVRRKAAVELAEIQVRNLARALDQNISGTFQRIDLALGSVVAEIEGDYQGGRLKMADVDLFLAKEGRLLPEPGFIWVTDATGQVILGSHKIPELPDWSSRWWFQEFRDHPPAGMIVAKPMIGFLSKVWVITCVRRYDRPDGMPPEGEQGRILQRVGELMEIVERIRLALANERQLVSSFAAAAVHHLEV